MEFSPIVSFNIISTVVWYVFCVGERRESYRILYNCRFLSSNSFIPSGNLQLVDFLLLLLALSGPLSHIRKKLCCRCPGHAGDGVLHGHDGAHDPRRDVLCVP